MEAFSEYHILYRIITTSRYFYNFHAGTLIKNKAAFIFNETKQ